MTATLYRPLSEDFPTFGDAKLTDIFSIISFDYTKRFYSVGEFTMEIPVDEPAVPFIERDTILITDTGDSLYVTDTKENERTFVIEGKDLKVLLSMRITLFPNEEQEKGTYGYYVVKGATEYCIKDIVQYNISNAAEEERRIYGFTVAGGGSKGIADDRYMTRLEALDYVAEKLCKNAGIGWDVTVDIDRNEYIFDVIEPTDRSEHQTDVSKVIFSKDFFNVKSYTHERGTSSLKNAIYAVNSGGGDPYVQLVYKDENTVSGVLRKETTASVSCDYDEIQDYARKSVEDKIETDNSTVDVFAADNYKKEWFLGDICTFVCGDQMHDYLITEVHVNISGDGYAVDITAGDKPPTTVGALSNTVYQNSRSIEREILTENGVGKFTNDEKNSEIFNDYENNTAEGVFNHTAGQNNKNAGHFNSICGGQENAINSGSAVIANFIGSGQRNVIKTNTAMCSAIVGGADNIIGEGMSLYSVIVGGSGNQIIKSQYSLIGAGEKNVLAGQSYHSAIAAGTGNIIRQEKAFIGAGENNEINHYMSAILAGKGNRITNDNDINYPCDVILAGENNRIAGSGGYNCIIDGTGNTINGISHNLIAGGTGNNITGGNDFAFGRGNVLSGFQSVAIGNNINSRANFSYAFGENIKIGLANQSVAFGKDINIGDGMWQIIFGQSNQPTADVTPYPALFVIANFGNKLVLDSAGNLYIPGDIYTNGASHPGANASSASAETKGE